MVKLNYIQHNREYQRQLDQGYKGYVVPVDRWINNDKATIKHHCLQCGEWFYARPHLLLNVESQSHICYVPYGDFNGCRTVYNRGNESRHTKHHRIRTRTQITAETKRQIYSMADQGMKQSEIARCLEVSRPTVSKYLKVRGDIK